jgi:hypothetical protein
MNPVIQRMQEAISTIDKFMVGTAQGRLTITPAQFRELSCCIQLAKSARGERAHIPPNDSSFSKLCDCYRRSLERLRAQLQQIETELNLERARLVTEHSQLSRTREWHDQLSRTQ